MCEFAHKLCVMVLLQYEVFQAVLCKEAKFHVLRLGWVKNKVWYIPNLDNILSECYCDSSCRIALTYTGMYRLFGVQDKFHELICKHSCGIFLIMMPPFVRHTVTS